MIVTDNELQELIERKNNPLLTDYDPPVNWSDKDSLVQPCSIDLHIGAVFQPGVKPGKAGSAENPKSELVLKTGQTAIVVTKESIHLPSDYAGYGFPPSHVSSKALLMTNPGHIDPGYSGKLQFTVINMGREDYVLRSRDLIVTILIFKLPTKANTDYGARHSKPAGSTVVEVQQPAASIDRLIFKLATKVVAHFAPRGVASSSIAQDDIDRLSPDFVDVQRRATSIARKTLGYSTVGASVLAILLSWGVNVAEERFGRMSKMEARLMQVEAKDSSLAKELQSTKEQLAKQLDVDNRLTKLELESKPKGAPK
jgi:deoxycytidine triphosphate deaminase